MSVKAFRFNDNLKNDTCQDSVVRGNRTLKSYAPVTLGGDNDVLDVVKVIFGSGRVNITPALVPIHSWSLHVSRAVTRRHAILCCRIISSAAVTDKETVLCHVSRSLSKLRRCC